MRLVRLATCLVGSLVWSAAAAMAQVHDVKTELAANAALQYWQAFSQIPALDKDQEKTLGESGTVSLDDPGVSKLLAASHSSLMFLHRGAALPKCDWGLDYNDGISMLMPHLAKARDLARLAALEGRRAFEHRNWKAGRQDATSIMVLARHIGRDPVMIALLVRLGLEGMVVDLVAPYVPEIKTSYAQAAAMFDEMPPAVTLEQSIRFEKKWMAGWIIPHLKAEEQRQKGAGMEMWKKFLDEGAPAALKNVATIEEVYKLVDDMLPVYDDLARMAALPNDQFEAQYPAFKQKTKTDHALAALLLPSIATLRAKEQRQQARMGMLLAGIAVVESGEGKLKELKQPFGPYEYRALDKGFELKSKLLYEGQPVTLTIGQRK
jgi:hypothetical protein